MDGENISAMLRSLQEHDGSVEPFRNSLIISNFTRTDEQKDRLGQILLSLPEELADGLVTVAYSHKYIRISWRAGDHDMVTMTSAIKGEGESTQRFYSEGRYEDSSDSKTCSFKSKLANVNEAYSGLWRYFEKMRSAHPTFKLKVVVLAGEIGGRGVRYKTAKTHNFYLTDLFFSFDVSRKKQLTMHGELAIQVSGRLCTLLKDLSGLFVRPRLWTPKDCWYVIKTCRLAVDEWVRLIQTKPADEAPEEALVRALHDTPAQYPMLERIYRTPVGTTASGKDHFVDESRMKPAEKLARKRVHDATAQVPKAVGDHDIAEDTQPDVIGRIDAALEEAAKESSDDDESSDERNPRRRRLLAPADAARQAELGAMYKAADEATKGTDAEGKMPRIGAVIEVVWRPASGDAKFPYYPALVTDLVRNDNVDAFPVLYVLQWTTEEDLTPIPEAQREPPTIHELDADMNEWRPVAATRQKINQPAAAAGL
jgi:hypothetical protein